MAKRKKAKGYKVGNTVTIKRRGKLRHYRVAKVGASK